MVESAATPASVQRLSGIRRIVSPGAIGAGRIRAARARVSSHQFNLFHHLRNFWSPPAVLVFAILGSTPFQAAKAAPFDWGINEDYKQLDARGATDFDILLKGAVAGNITGGGMSSVTNPFAGPSLTTSSDAFGNTIVHFSGTSTIASDPAANRHFGIFGTGSKPTVLAKAWSYATAPARVAVPLANLSFQYNPGTAALTFFVQNTTSDTVTLQDVGYIASSTEFPIDDLNRTILPPGSFTPLTALDHQYAPSVSDMMTFADVPATDFFTAYGTVLFSGPSSGNPYDSTGGEWAEVAVAAAAIPEPGTLSLVLLGLAGLAAIRRNRHRGGAAGALADSRCGICAGRPRRRLRAEPGDLGSR